MFGWVIALVFSFIIYLCHLIHTVQDNQKFGWGTIFLFYKLKKKNVVDFGYNVMTFISYHKIHILFDPISLLLICLYFLYIIFYKLIKNFLTSNFFKSYNKVESEEILDKLTE